MSDNTNDKKLNIVLTQRDGWNFGLGFMGAALVFTVVIIPVIGCAGALMVAMLPSLFS